MVDEPLQDVLAFEFHNVQLSSALVKLSTVGFYFDEVAGAISTVQIPLEADADGPIGKYRSWARQFYALEGNGGGRRSLLTRERSADQ